MTTLITVRARSSHLLYDCLFKQSNLPIRGNKFLTKIRSKSVLDRSSYKLVYDFRLIILPAAILRTKLWFPPLSVAAAPVVYFLTGTIGHSVICILSACAYASTGFLLSKVTKNMVGKIYVNKEGDVREVLVSSVNGVGKRVDRVHQLDEFINYDFPSKIHRSLGFVAVGVENSTTVYNINTHYCKLIDPGICKYLFGNIWFTHLDHKKKSEEETNPEREKLLRDK